MPGEWDCGCGGHDCGRTLGFLLGLLDVPALLFSWPVIATCVLGRGMFHGRCAQARGTAWLMALRCCTIRPSFSGSVIT